MKPPTTAQQAVLDAAEDASERACKAMLAIAADQRKLVNLMAAAELQTVLDQLRTQADGLLALIDLVQEVQDSIRGAGWTGLRNLDVMRAAQRGAVRQGGLPPGMNG